MLSCLARAHLLRIRVDEYAQRLQINRAPRHGILIWQLEPMLSCRACVRISHISAWVCMPRDCTHTVPIDMASLYDSLSPRSSAAHERIPLRISVWASKPRDCTSRSVPLDKASLYGSKSPQANLPRMSAFPTWPEISQKTLHAQRASRHGFLGFLTWQLEPMLSCRSCARISHPSVWVYMP